MGDMTDTLSVVRLVLAVLTPWFGLKRKVGQLESRNRALELRNAALEQQVADYRQAFLCFAVFCVFIVLVFASARRTAVI